MTIQEFLNQLRDSLDGQLPYNEIVANLNYYRDYMAAQQGTKSEEEITAGLGDPRLIARTIIDTYQMNHENQVHYQSYSYSEDGSYQSTKSTGEYTNQEKQSDKKHKRDMKVATISGWLGCLISLFILLIVIGAVFWLGTLAFKVFFRFVLPVIIVVAGVSYLVNKFKK